MPTLNIKIKLTHQSVCIVLESLKFKRIKRKINLTHGVKNYYRPVDIIVYKHKKGEINLPNSRLSNLISDSDYNSIRTFVDMMRIITADKFDRMMLDMSNHEKRLKKFNKQLEHDGLNEMW